MYWRWAYSPQAASARRSIRNCKAGTATISATKEGGDIAVTYETTLAPDQVLNIALVQLYGMNEVSGGANAGKKLEHTNIVRELRVVNTSMGMGKLPLPKDVDLTNYHIVAYKQNKNTMEITGVTEVPIK